MIAILDALVANPYQGAGVGLAAIALGALVGYYGGLRDGQNNLEEEVCKKLDEADGVVTFDPPNVGSSPLDYLRAMRHLQKQRYAAKRGWVKWYRIGANWKRPKWVKPRQTGSGALKISQDGQPYYFEEEAMLSDAETGAWVAVHREGEADPINLRDPAYPGIKADRMERIINLEAEGTPPGLLDNLFGMDDQTLMWLGIGALFIAFVGYRYMTGAM